MLVKAESTSHTDHKGHEKAHTQIGLIVILTLIGSQFAISAWKKYHPRSHNWASLFGLWFIPPLIALRAGYYPYLSTWLFFSLANGVVVRRAFEKPLRTSTPNVVFRWYAAIYSIGYIVGISGYILVITSFFRFPEILFGISLQSEVSLFHYGLIIMFYGLYFGCLGRDFVDRLSDVMVHSLGYYNRTGFPSKHLRSHVCAICGGSTDDASQHPVPTSSWFTRIFYFGQQFGKGDIHTLPCKHVYHEACIRGWTLIGKKDICPYCKEKVDLGRFSRGSNPWDTSQILYLNLLDALRHIVVWNPIVLVLLHIFFDLIGLN